MQHSDAPRLPADAAHAAARWIREQWCKAGLDKWHPQVGIILGSGLGDLLRNADLKLRLPYADIPFFGPTTVNGHEGILECGDVNGQSVAVLRGRYHLYEGHAPDQLALPVRTLHELGVESLIVTNAAGGLNPSYHQGDLMIMRDHIGLPTLSGQHPLIGPNDDTLGPRFPPMATAYDPEMIRDVLEIARKRALPLHEGVYIMVSGPTYETPAEMRFLRRLGADAVGMSTVPEVIAARHAGMKVLGISCITNAATPKAASTVNHEEVLNGAAATLPKLDLLLTSYLAEMARRARGEVEVTLSDPLRSSEALDADLLRHEPAENGHRHSSHPVSAHSPGDR
jgi:purine-nucleoside phosphorylase